MSLSSVRLVVGLASLILGGLFLAVGSGDDGAFVLFLLAFPCLAFGAVFFTIGLVAKGVAIGMTEAQKRMP